MFSISTIASNLLKRKTQTENDRSRIPRDKRSIELNQEQTT